MALPEGVFTFDPEKDPNGPRVDDTRLQGLTDANQAFDDGSMNDAQQLTSQVNPYTHKEPTMAELAQFINQGGQQTVTQPPPQEDEISRLKKIIGDQGNQLGEQRKLTQLLMQRLEQQTPQTMAAQAPQPVGRLFNRDPNDYPTAQEIESGLIRAGQILMDNMQSQIEAAKAESLLAASGVSQEERQMLELQYPSLKTLDAATRVSVVTQLAKANRQQAQQATVQSNQATTQTVQNAVRQRVFVEQPQTVTTIPSAGAQIDVDAFGNIKSADQMAQQLQKLGIGRVNDIGRRG